MTKRTTFTVRPESDKVHRCSRCTRSIRKGERATSIVTQGIAETRHAGRTCPPTYVDRHPFLRSTSR